MRITQKGQVTIPESIRKQYGLLPYTEINFIEENGRVYIQPADKRKRGNEVIKQLRGRATVRMTTDEIMSLTRGKK